MVKTFISLAFLSLITIPILILVLAFYQDLIETIKPKSKQKRAVRQSYYDDSKDILQTKLKVIK